MTNTKNLKKFCYGFNFNKPLQLANYRGQLYKVPYYLKKEIY